MRDPNPGRDTWLEQDRRHREKLADHDEKIARLQAERDRLREANQVLREFIAELNNTARHEWAQAVDDATQRLFRKMSANRIIRDALVDAALAKENDLK